MSLWKYCYTNATFCLFTQIAPAVHYVLFTDYIRISTHHQPGIASTKTRPYKISSHSRTNTKKATRMRKKKEENYSPTRPSLRLKEFDSQLIYIILYVVSKWMLVVCSKIVYIQSSIKQAATSVYNTK